MSVSSEPARKWPVAGRVRILLILAVCACWTLLYADMIRRTLGPGDDNLYLQSIALSANSPSRLAALNHELIDSLDKLGYDDYVLYRVVLRSKYTNNYWAASNIQSLAAWLLPVDPALGMRAYHEVVATRAVLGSIATGFICLAALAAGLFLIRDPKLLAAAIIGLCATAALFSSTTQAAFQTLLPHIPDRVADNMSWIAAFGRSAYFFIDPGLEFGMFGTTPRSNFVVLSFVAALMRWDRRITLSYLMLAVAILFHASAGSIMLTLFVISNLAFRPSEVIRPMPMASIAICVALAVSQESLAKLLGFNAIIGVASFLVLLLLSFGLYQLMKKLDLKPSRIGSFLDSTFPDRMTADIVIFLLFWNASLAMVLGRLGYLDFASIAYLWSQFHARTAAILQPLLITAIAMFVLRAAPRISSRVVVALSLGLLVVAFARNQITPGDPRPEYVRNLAGLEARRLAAFPYAKTPPFDDEPLWYYAILRSLDFNTKELGLVAR